MGSTARGFHHIDEAAHGGVVSVGPPHGDIDGTISRNLLRVQFTAIANGLGFLNIGVFASDTPNSGNRFAFGQVIHEILHTAGMAEFLDTGVGILRSLRLCRNIGFLDLLRSFLVTGASCSDSSLSAFPAVHHLQHLQYRRLPAFRRLIHRRFPEYSHR